MWYYVIYSCKSMWACRALCAPHSSLFSPHSTLNITFTARWRGRTAPLNEAAAERERKRKRERERERDVQHLFFSPHSVYLFTPGVRRALQSNLESFLCSVSDCLEQNAGEIWSQREIKRWWTGELWEWTAEWESLRAKITGREREGVD